MKFLLVGLMSFILMEAPVFAIHGGYSLQGTQNLVGTYAGVMIPLTVGDTSGTTSGSSPTAIGYSSLGLFTLGAGSTGLDTGAAVIFSGTATYTGSITALLNPDADNPGFTGVIQTEYAFTYTQTLTDGTITFLGGISSAAGSFVTSAIQNPGSVGGFGLDLTGTSIVSTSYPDPLTGEPIQAGTVTFMVEGYEQSNQVTVTTGT